MQDLEQQKQEVQRLRGVECSLQATLQSWGPRGARLEASQWAQKPWLMPQVWRSRPKVGKKDAKAQELTKQIASLAREKNLAKAVEVFQQFQRHGLC